MSLRRRQMARVLNEVIKEALQAGRYPSIQSISSKIRKWQKEHIPGTPSLTLRPAVKHGRSSSEDYNQCMIELRQDLEDVYEETKSQVNRLLTNFDYNETERRRLMHELAKLEAKIDNFILLAKDSEGYVEAFYDTFNDLKYVDISQTTAFVDLQNGFVINPELESKLLKVDLSSAVASVTCLQNDVLSELVEPITNCLDDNINTSWKQKITSTTAKEINLYLDIVLNNITKINSITFCSHSPKSMIVEIFYSNDGSSWSSFPEQQPKNVSGIVTWNFREIEVKFIRFKITKKEPDEVIDTKSIYYFGAKNISVRRIGYVSESTLVSKPFTTKRDRISKVALEVDQEVPQGTSIEYYISPAGEELWQPISPINDPQPKWEKVISLADMQIFTPVIFTGRGVYDPVKDETYRGIEFYDIYTTNYVPVDGTEVLYRGIWQWRREDYCYIPPQTVSPSMRDFVPSLFNWMRLPASRISDVAGDDQLYQLTERDIGTSYFNIMSSAPNIDEKVPLDLNFDGMKTEFGPNVLASNSPGHYFLFTTSVYSEKSVPSTKVAFEYGGCKLAIYNNHRELPQKLYTNEMGKKMCEVEMKLVQGWNTLQIVVYKNVSSEEENLYVKLNVASNSIRELLLPIMRSYVHYIRADIYPMIKTSLYDLKNNVLMNDHDKYAIDIRNNGDIQEAHVIVNHKTGGINFGMQYRFVNEGSDKCTQIQLKANLKRDDVATDTITPRINSYRIKVL